MTEYSLIKSLSEMKSSSGGTSLVTYYIPNNIQMAIQKLNQELCTSYNIKSKAVRKDVIHALKSGIYVLKNYEGSIDNGIVLCSGITNVKYCL